MAFKVGMKVVCIKACGPSNLWIHIKEGDIHQISHFAKDGSLNFKDKKIEGIYLHGVGILQGYEPGYFKPLDENFADEVLANITEQIETEELVLV